ncbi:hypothetical protein ACTFQO_04560 [Bacillus cereus group sp. MYBK29-1]|uniref:hypothetical protein n=1 Tax=Bacillus cereus group TaxID=86661 RepID=UPI0022E1B34B|nr:MULTISPECIES: hypothetical protein [Bacillus cereus group]MDA1532963.1 hypothetical protein [Bacillus cereus group sp. TH254-2LC]MDA1577863.1 hypothetical protein [Bacillus cereus group sp. TH228LC]MEC3466707.1 hypothetical protein [Bacillus tropicus]HDR7779527.1 hypothetical protein [Bacillus tropicus]
MLTNNSPENILHTAYEAKMISSGDNSPSIKIKGTKLQYLLAMLHLGFESNIVKMVLGWTNEEFEERINSLEVEGLLKQTGGRYYPTCMVITACEGKKLYNLCEPLIKQTLKIIENHSNSLLLYSGVLLDFGQINYIEENYLKKKRPLRNKKRYYYAIQEQELADIEAFGMYGNTYLDLGEVQIGLYGNSRYSTLNLITANNEIFEEYFQNTNTDINYKKKQLVKGFVAADRQIDLHLNVVYEKLGLYQNSQPVIPVFKSTDLFILNEIANTISEDLVLLFNENDKPLKQYFASSRYSKEITYVEFFIWWYHFFYTKVTEELIKQGVIITSTQKNQTYIIHQ